MLKRTILSTKNTPAVNLYPEGVIKITGRSMEGNFTEFFEQIVEWIDEYVINPAEMTRVDICMEYLNEINLNIYFSILKKIESVKLKNKKYLINWYYEEGDEDILEKGEKISIALDIPFNFIMTDDPLVAEYDSPGVVTKLN